ncbi:hypothetical protein BU26DRAFT_568813 [Trematosphaeria pertusa]|uniref:Uncharacterized protein n=1 Tax=Trematosphaeria pertusa TaxID=390896 RepID=A0A6A6I486_9PLEO|nr:uncharacterized protein BU26DRAFT_568813 [Trematosphaeria pertusa]KAF2244818.1 hypothetical protein BU26DRAFT_568813 [Trematosphaeria pertusa]
MAWHLLPGELRNRIYEYALTEPGGLLYYKHEGAGRLCAYRHAQEKEDGGEEIKATNQLQYVNCELRAETKGLGLCFNNITFEPASEDDLFEDCVQFLNEVSIRQRSRLRSLTITVYGRQRVLHFADSRWYPLLHNFAKDYPDCQIRICTDGLSQGSNYLIYRAVLLAVITRRDDETRRGLSIFTAMTQDLLLGELKRKYPQFFVEEYLSLIGGPVAPNIRFFPADLVFKPDMFRSTLQRSKGFTDLIASSIAGGMDAWMERAQEIYEGGI